MPKSNLTVVSSDTHFENVLAYYMNNDLPEEDRRNLLSQKELDLKERWETAFTALLEWRSPEDAVKRVMNLFGVSKATAYRDVQRCEMLFGSFKRFDKEAWRYISIERKHKLYQLAMKEKNLELAHKIDISIDKLLGLDQEDSSFDPDKIKAQDYAIMLSKKQERLIQQIMSKGGPVNMNVADIQEIDFEVINEGENEGD